MCDGFNNTGRAVIIDTEIIGFIRTAVQMSVTDRTFRRENIGLLRSVSLFTDTADNFRNDIAGFADNNHILFADIALFDQIFVVQRRKGYGRSG
ncbi:hypothetical protein SDC9_146873 [bioreactor metagenome]|uniref:Uncharacterized protein n=1 Tax=bioreactor metagenome TaxID=1076179 RepID=A0A645EEC5_9ZZZZ